MAGRLFVDVDPRELRVPPSRRSGADPIKLQRQIARFGRSSSGMPTILVQRGSDGELMIMDGVTRATRLAKLNPGQTVSVEIIKDSKRPYGSLPTIEDLLP